MAHINFVIPTNIQELLSDSSDYYIENVVCSKELIGELKNATQALKDEGPDFIVDAFKTYYSVLYHGGTLPMDVIFKTYEVLHRATSQLNKTLGFILEDKESLNEELQMKYVTILKMTLYLYTETVLMIVQKNEAKNQCLLKKRGKAKSDEQFSVDKKSILILLNNIIQREINLFWDPPIVEDSFINLISEICYRFLQDPTIKGEKEVRVELFNLIGLLIKDYNHGKTFVIRIVQLVKLHENLIHSVPEGVQQLVENFNCKGLVHDLIREMTEWQTEEEYESNQQGARYCATVLSTMASLMPNLMIPEVMFLDKYLGHDSVPLRNSILAVITEVVLNVLTGHELTEEQRESRDDFLGILMEHMEDVSMLVRSKVMQHWARLQKESAIPLKFQHTVLSRVIEALYDKGVLVRKAAIHCVTTFLTYNTFGAQLSLKAAQKELDEKKNLLIKVNEPFEALKMKRLLELEDIWNSKRDDIKAVVDEELSKEEDDEEEEPGTADKEKIPKESMCEMIRLYLNEGKYKEAFKLCKTATEEVEDFKQFSDNNEPHRGSLFATILHTIFISADKIREEMKSSQTEGGLSEEDFQKLETLETAVEFYTSCVNYLQLIDGTIDAMVDLLETTSVSDMHEAIEFFISAYQFNIDNASRGILAMLKLMQRNEQERKECVVNAFKKIFLETNATNMEGHCITIANRLISLLKTLPEDAYDSLELIVSDWTSKGTLDNSVIDMLWQYFTQKRSVTDEDSCAAVVLLRMCALGRKTIVTRNLKLVAMLAFGERGENNMLFLGAACQFMAVAGKERIDITSKSPPFKIKPDDEGFQMLLDLLSKKFFEPVEYYTKALFGALDYIYKLCSKPDKLSEILLEKTVNKLAGDSKGNAIEMDRHVLTRLCQMLGYMALKQLEYLDETVYRELKRRNNIREERRQSKHSKKHRKSKSRVSALSTNYDESVLNTSLGDESILEGAQAEDTDAEFILNVLENHTVTGTGALGKLAYIIRGICERPHVYKDVILQGAAVIALIRYMLVSSKFCQQNIQLLFTIFEKTTHPEVKQSILLHTSDLLTRFPNIIEPWTPRIYQSLKDPLQSTRRTTFFTLGHLILNDMIRGHSHIYQMALCLIDDDKDLKDMCRTFFINLSGKENNLYNVLPDIFSHLMDESLTREHIQGIMKFLFELLDKSKHIENLVDRFCCKFMATEDVEYHRCIAYCLTLIAYNEKSLRKLIENFPTFKHLVHDEEIYASLQNIIQTSSKQQTGKADLKGFVTELEENINSMFELKEDGTIKKPPAPPKSTTKRKTTKSVMKRTKKKQNSDTEEDLDETEKSSVNDSTARKSKRKRHVRQIRNESDSD